MNTDIEHLEKCYTMPSFTDTKVNLHICSLMEAYNNTDDKEEQELIYQQAHKLNPKMASTPQKWFNLCWFYRKTDAHLTGK